jgi:hypothetical protein
MDSRIAPNFNPRPRVGTIMRRTTRATLFPALCLALLLAGCANSNHTENKIAVSPRPSSQTFVANVAELVAAGNKTLLPPPFGAVSVQEGPQGGAPVYGVSAHVAANATAILVEAKFTCQSPTCAYFTQLERPDRVNVNGPTAQGALRWEAVKEPPVAVGSWSVAILPDSASVNMAGSLRLTIFYGQSIPAGFTAFA